MNVLLNISPKGMSHFFSFFFSYLLFNMHARKILCVFVAKAPKHLKLKPHEVSALISINVSGDSYSCSEIFRRCLK